MELKESQSWKNMEAALAAEAVAYVEYFFYSQQAKKDDYTQISNIFLETADNELHHAKLLFKKLHDGAVPPTLECLHLARESELFEWDVQYKEFAKTAEEEGFHDLSLFFERLAKIEHTHMDRFDILTERIKNDQVFKREEVQVWRCTVCGHIHIGKEAPEICPVCDHDRGHFEIKADNY